MAVPILNRINMVKLYKSLQNNFVLLSFLQIANLLYETFAAVTVKKSF